MNAVCQAIFMDTIEQANQVDSLTVPTAKQIKQWRRNLAEERAEEAIYRQLALQSTGKQRAILLQMAQAEQRHQHYWMTRLGNYIGSPVPPSIRTRFLGFLARHFSLVFALVLMQYAEERSINTANSDASLQIQADEKIHAEVIRSLAAQGRKELAGTFRAAIFGANDGVVSNLALVMGVVGAGLSNSSIIITGLTGLLAGALSMAVGEYISVASQRELLQASHSSLSTLGVIDDIDVQANEIELVFRARGLSEAEAKAAAAAAFEKRGIVDGEAEKFTEVGHPFAAAISSFTFFAIGALVPVLPFMLGVTGVTGMVTSLVLVGLVLSFTGSFVGVMSGTSILKHGSRQLLLGYCAATITFLLGTIGGGIFG